MSIQKIQMKNFLQLLVPGQGILFSLLRILRLNLKSKKDRFQPSKTELMTKRKYIVNLEII